MDEAGESNLLKLQLTFVEAYIDPAVFSKIIGILQQLNNCSVICITTPEGTPNAYFERMINTPRPNNLARKLFKQYNIELVCDACKLRKIATRCIHANGLIPFWMDDIRRKYAEAMITDKVNKNLYNN